MPSQYQVIDDYSSTSALPGGNTSPGGGAPVSPVFTAPSVSAAGQVAYLISSALQRPVRLVVFGGTPPWTLIVGAPPGTQLTSAPSGIGF